MELYVNQLILEMGRDCTMNCSHCLRGSKENAKLDVNMAKKLINSVEYIGQIIFTGGEPLLYADEIIEIIDYIMSQEKKCAGFYIASNGSLVVSKLMYKLCEFVQYCQQLYFDDEFYNCKFDISVDKFHSSISKKNLAFYRLFRFCDTRGENLTEENVIKEGMAYLSGYGWREFDNSPKKFYIAENNYGSKPFSEVEMLYMNSFGQMFPNCDLSYNSQREWADEHPYYLPDIHNVKPLVNPVLQQILDWNEMLDKEKDIAA